MADPILTDIYRAQVRCPGKSGLPEDVYVNTFAFRNEQGPDIPSPVGPIVNMLSAFYGFLLPFLSGVTTRWDQATVRVYDLGQEPPRYPVEEELGLAVGTGTNALPEEVALVLSLYSERNLPRRRGRIYIGPLGTNVMTTSTSMVFPSDNVRNAMLDAAANMIQSTENATWGVVSARDQAFYPFTNAWVDDAFDTQRRRGRAPVGRKVWPVAP